MTAFHSSTFRLLEIKPHDSVTALAELEDVERRLGIRLPASVRGWYCNEEALDILAKYSNQDFPIPLREFAVKECKTQRLLLFKYENQGVCVWAIAVSVAYEG